MKKLSGIKFWLPAVAAIGLGAYFYFLGSSETNPLDDTVIASAPVDVVQDTPVAAPAESVVALIATPVQDEAENIETPTPAAEPSEPAPVSPAVVETPTEPPAATVPASPPVVETPEEPSPEEISVEAPVTAAPEIQLAQEPKPETTIETESVAVPQPTQTEPATPEQTSLPEIVVATPIAPEPQEIINTEPEIQEPEGSEQASQTPVAPMVAPEITEEPQIATGPSPEISLVPNLPSTAPQPDINVGLQAGNSNPVVFSATTLTLQTIAQPDTAPNPEQVIASFDIVRVDASGSTLVAGQAAPNAQVNIISGGEIVAKTTSNAAGEFVAFLATPVAQPEAIELAPGVNQTEGIVSQAQVIILPVLPQTPNAAPVVVLATQDSLQIIQPSGLSVPDTISLDSISYNDAGVVILAGRGTPNRMARIYADDNLIAGSTITESGSWGASLTDLVAGRYVLRVDEIMADGSVASRVESPFQREFPAALALNEFAQGAKIIVQPGNTLWLMATQAYGNGDFYTQIFAANRDAIRDPDLIYPGQVFSIPKTQE